MKKLDIRRMINPRKPLAHGIMLIFSLGIAGISMISNTRFDFSGFLVTFFQLELFILLAYHLFRHVPLGKTAGETTRVVLARFAVFFIACFASALLVVITSHCVEQLMAGKLVSNAVTDFFANDFQNWFTSTLAGLSFGGVIFIIVLWQDTLHREQKLREENLIFQHETLKSQVNPHFLFNSLNTLSALVVTQPEHAERFIGKLSAIYRYILENLSKDRISLQAELNFIQQFVELHQMRGEDKIILMIHVKDADRLEIIPVSLQILVENVLKHNRATVKEPLTINITQEGRYIVVINNLQKMASGVRSTGIGLKNLANRVKLISGDELLIEETSAHYIVKIPLLP